MSINIFHSNKQPHSPKIIKKSFVSDVSDSTEKENGVATSSTLISAEESKQDIPIATTTSPVHMHAGPPSSFVIAEADMQQIQEHLGAIFQRLNLVLEILPPPIVSASSATAQSKP